MKIVIFLFYSVFLYFGLNGQDILYKNISECQNYNSFLTSSSYNSLNNYADTILQNGTIIFDEYKYNEFGSFNSNFTKFNLNNDYHFEFEKEIPSRFDESYSFKRYQQYFKGVRVDGGGYSIKTKTGPNNPCGPTAAEILSPYILTNININEIPNITKEQALLTIGSSSVYNNNETDIISPELVISHNLLNNCAYHLTWKIFHFDQTLKLTWIDAHTNTILKSIDVSMDINAPTETYGQQNLLDFTSSGITRLQTPNNRIRTFNFENFCPNADLNRTEWRNSLIPETPNQEWTNESTPAVYQTHFVIDEELPIFEELGINFGQVNAGVGTCDGAYAMNGATLDEAYIYLGRFGSTTSLFDVIAHELGHVYLDNFLDYKSR